MGCLFAGALAAAGKQVTLLLRDTGGAREATIHIDGEWGKRSHPLPLSATTDTDAIDHLLVTTKAHDVEAAIAGIAARLSPGAQVLLLVNGMGLAERLTESYPGLQLYCGTTTEGAYRTAPLQIRHAGRGQTRIGHLGGSPPPPWLQDWTTAVENCDWTPDIGSALWHKLAINCAINPLSALHRCHNGELAARPELARQLQVLCDEIALISEAAGFTATARELHQAVPRVVAATANNRSSMLQDILARRRTEIDHITGYLLQVAAEHGLDAPHNRLLMQEITRLDR